MEWTPSIGFNLRGAGCELRYALSMTCGAGGSCMDCMIVCGDDVTVAAPDAGGVIAAYTQPIWYHAASLEFGPFNNEDPSISSPVAWSY